MIRILPNRALAPITLAAAMAVASSAAVMAETPAQFYKGKELTLLVGGNPGGGYATYADVLARHYGQHIPGKPHIVAKSMPGAGGVKATQLLYNRSPRDGTTFAAVFMGSVTDPMFSEKKDTFDATKLIYIGSLNRETSLCMAWHTSPVKTFSDLYHHQLVVGASGWDSSIRQYPAVLHNILGVKLKIISGYKGSGPARLAMERGETSGLCGLQWSSAKNSMGKWIREGKVRILAQLAPRPNPQLVKLGVPMIWKFVKNKKDKEALELMFGQLTFGRPYILPPGVPGDRVKALRTAFMAMTRDPAFLEDAKKARIGIDPVSGADVTKAVKKLFDSNPAVIARVKKALAKPKK